MSDNSAHASAAPGFPDRPFVLRDSRPALLRRVVESDAPRILERLPQAHRESEFLAFMAGEFDWTLEQEREFIRDRADLENGVLLGVEVKGLLIALCGAHRLPRRRYRHHAELGMTVLKDFWGLGVGQAMMEGLLSWARDRHLRKLYLRAASRNVRALALYRKFGFAEEGCLRDDWLLGDGSFTDTIIMAAAADGLVYAADLSGFLYCFDAATGKQHWKYDTLAAVWGSPYVVDGKVMLGDEDGEVVVLKHDKTLTELATMDMGNAVYTTPVASHGVLYVTNRRMLFAISESK